MKQYRLRMDFYYKKLFKVGTIVSEFWTGEIYYNNSDGIPADIVENNPLIFEPLKESKVKVEIININEN